VIKLGGAAMVDPKLEEQFAEDIILLESVGLCPIIVHGGGPEISSTLERLGHKTKFIDGLRVTDEDSMQVVEMVLSGKVNQRLVAAINRHSAKGVGLSGKDGGLLRAKQHESGQRLGRVGQVHSINTSLIEMLLDDGRIPVVSPVGLGDDGQAYNINADVVAAELASALNAEKLIFMSDVPGFLEQGKVVPELSGDQLKLRINRGEVTGGMLPKLQAALNSLKNGVKRVHLVDGRVPHNLIAELFTDRGVGTLIQKS
jgi:acetylglutamate kinase